MRKLLLMVVCCFALGCAFGKVHYTMKPETELNGFKIGLVSVSGYKQDNAEGVLLEEFLLRDAEVIKESQVVSRLKQKGLGIAFVDDSTAVEIGKELGLDAVFIASVSKPTMTNKVHWMDSSLMTYTVTFKARLIDVKTGNLLIDGFSTGQRGYRNLAVEEAVRNYFKQVR